MPNYPLLVLSENRWRAQRYGLEHGFIDLRREEIVTSDVLIDELLEMIREDAEYFDSNAEVGHARRILARGTGADRQLALYQQQLDHGLTPSQALKAIVDHLVVETVANVKAFGPTALAACA